MKRKIESGFMNIYRDGKLESVRTRTVRRKLETDIPQTNTDASKTTLANKNRLANDKGNIGTKTDETNMKKMSVLERRKACKESAKLRSMLCALGCDSKKLESAEAIKTINELIKCCGNIKEYKSDVKPDAEGKTVTIESAKPKKIRKAKK